MAQDAAAQIDMKVSGSLLYCRFYSVYFSIDFCTLYLKKKGLLKHFIYISFSYCLGSFTLIL